ncbi:MAG: metallophosphoesterase [Hyphomicrobiaceae bacterium]
MADECDIGMGDGDVLVFGGPYSNIEATRAMRARARELSIPPERTICTGDVVAYGADPNATCAEVRDWGCHVIAGNCEVQLAAGAADCGCGFEDGTACDQLSRGWYPYADATLDRQHRLWMARLPGRLNFTVAGFRFAVVHGAESDIARFLFAGSPAAEKAAEAERLGADIVLAGHCGIPFAEVVAGSGHPKLWFNAGVIGMPANDGTLDGWYGVISPDGKAGGNGHRPLRFSLHRLSYDAAEAAASLERAGSAPEYACALRTGMWPSLDVLPPAERAARGVPLKEAAMTFP